MPWIIVWLGAAALEIAPINTGSVLIDEFASRFVYFYSGYVFARYVFALADEAAGDRAMALTGLALWAMLNAVPRLPTATATCPSSAWRSASPARSPIVAGATRDRADAGRRRPFRWLGEHSIVVYLAFFLPMAVSRAVLLKTGIITDVGTISLLVTLAGIAGPIVLYAFVQWTGFGKFLFERPAWAQIDGPYRGARGDGAGGIIGALLKVWLASTKARRSDCT